MPSLEAVAFKIYAFLMRVAHSARAPEQLQVDLLPLPRTSPVKTKASVPKEIQIWGLMIISPHWVLCTSWSQLQWSGRWNGPSGQDGSRRLGHMPTWPWGWTQSHPCPWTEGQGRAKGAPPRTWRNELTPNKTLTSGAHVTVKAFFPLKVNKTFTGQLSLFYSFWCGFFTCLYFDLFGNQFTHEGLLWRKWGEKGRTTFTVFLQMSDTLIYYVIQCSP